jgi:transcriptional regulator with XRE-family HTH domain
MITPQQSRMARAAINWTTRDLADAASVGINTVTRFENGREAMIGTVGKMRRALEAAGVEFIAENGGGAGVRLKKPIQGGRV